MLVKKLEELGIGRPSTYAPTISTIQNRDYVEKGEKTGTKHDICLLELKNGKIKETKKEESYGNEKNKLIPTDVGMVVNDFLMEYFPDIMDYNFTANVEEKFDHIAEGQTKWNDEIANFYKLFHPEVEKISNLRLEHKVGERVLGTDPKTGKEVSVKIGRFGPLVQLGSTDSEEKPQFASLQKGQSVSDITLEEALKLFELPRTLGDYEGETVTVAIGRFGPYVKHGKMFVSVPKTLSPQTITLDEAVELIKNKAEAEKKRLVKTFDEEPEMEILNGPYGVYISYKRRTTRFRRTRMRRRSRSMIAAQLSKRRQTHLKSRAAPCAALQKIIIAMTPTYIHLESIRSTNTYLAQNAEGAVHGTVVYADCQTAGRGQRGNSWESADFKNITMSMLLRPANVKPSCQFWLSEAVALAVVHTLDRYIDNGVSIKWPNDIYWNDRKICGILVEHSLSGGKIDHTIAGIGLNINQEKFLSDAPNPVSLRQIIGCDTPLPDVLHHLSEELLRLVDSLPDNAESLHAEFLSRLYRRNGLHTYRNVADRTADHLAAGEEFCAEIADVASDGILTLARPDGSRPRFAFKEVEFVIGK